MSKTAAVEVQIKPPRIEVAQFRIVGTSPYVQARFSGKAMQAMMSKMLAGSTARGKKAREARDFDEDYKQAMHISTEGWHGIPASAFRQAMISACRLVGFKMTLAKLSIFVEADGFDHVDGIPLIKLEGKPERIDMAVRNATGVADIRVRPMWRDWRRTCASAMTPISSRFQTSRTCSPASACRSASAKAGQTVENQLGLGGVRSGSSDGTRPHRKTRPRRSGQPAGANSHRCGAVVGG